MKEHFICTGGCNGVSDTPGTCQATDCSKFGKPLEECSCEDGTHEKKDGEKEDVSSS